MGEVSERLRASEFYIAQSRKHPGRTAVFREQEGPHECVADDLKDRAEAMRWISYHQSTNPVTVPEEKAS